MRNPYGEFENHKRNIPLNLFSLLSNEAKESNKFCNLIASLCKISYFPHRMFGIFLFEINIFTVRIFRTLTVLQFCAERGFETLQVLCHGLKICMRIGNAQILSKSKNSGYFRAQPLLPIYTYRFETLQMFLLCTENVHYNLDIIIWLFCLLVLLFSIWSLAHCLESCTIIEVRALIAFN